VDTGPLPEAIIVSLASDGSLRINQLAIQREEFRSRLERILALRADRVAFFQGNRSLEFQAVAQTLDLMHTAGATSVGLFTSELEKNR
jgi:biopolymer transport protein ExbD